MYKTSGCTMVLQYMTLIIIQNKLRTCESKNFLNLFFIFFYFLKISGWLYLNSCLQEIKSPISPYTCAPILNNH